MQIEQTKEIGFCSGVKRALGLLEKAVREYGKVETLGIVVHNQQVIDSFSRLGVKAVTHLEQLKGDIVVIPSHGVPPSVIQELKVRKLRIIDATCPNVRRVQTAAKELSEAGFAVIIFGDPEHPEVRGILGWAGSNGLATLDTKLATRLEELPTRIGFLSQTTRNPIYYTHFVNAITGSVLPQVEELRVVNTICDVVKRRQAEALELASRVDIMIVIGGRNSANTRCLAEICSSTGVETHHIETAAEIRESWLDNKSRVGMTSGTSTSDQTIQEVKLKLEEIDKRCKSKLLSC